MRKLLPLVFVSLVVAHAACGGEDAMVMPPAVVPPAAPTSPPASAAPASTESAAPATTASAVPTPLPPPEAPALVIEAIKLTGKTKDGKALSLEVKPDGSVTKGGKTLVATFAKNELKDETGATLLTVGADGKVTPKSGPGSWTFNEKDELVADGKVVVSVADDGSITFVGAKAEKVPGVKFEKLPAKSKRAATLLAVMLFMTGQSVTTLATPATSAAPPKGAPPAVPPTKK